MKPLKKRYVLGGLTVLKPEPILDEQVQVFTELIKDNEPAFTNFKSMSPSVRKNYTRLYFDANAEDAKKEG